MENLYCELETLKSLTLDMISCIFKSNINKMTDVFEL